MCTCTRRGAVWLFALCLIVSLVASQAFGEGLIVDNGQGRADIVIAENPTRGAKLAAAELQYYIEMISGVKLAIVTEPCKGSSSHIYVGASKYTDELNVNADGLKYDAFRMVSGDDWLVLLGRDVECGDMIYEFGGTVPRYVGFSLSKDDGRGSLNAVYGFLRTLGCRWYFPGQIGEIIPEMKTIALPEANETVHPDSMLREIYQYYNEFRNARDDEEILWQLRLGLNSGREVLGSTTRGHGISPVHSAPELKTEHPEYFAIWAGERAVDHMGSGAPCLSCEALYEDNAKYVRKVFDSGEPMVSVAPNDGYAFLCQCELCEGKGTPERGWTGLLSDYVWSYVNRVATEVYKTHPEQKVTCIAYSTYLLPPTKIEKLSPNVVVILCQWRSDYTNPAIRKKYTDIINGWLEVATSKQLFIWDYYLHGRRDTPTAGVPVYFTRIIDEDLKSLKGISGGEFIECIRNYHEWKLPWHALATNHLNVYVTARLYWDADQDLDALLDEYYQNFYGPAAEEMKTFVEYAEANWTKSLKDVAVMDSYVAMLNAAKAKACDTVYGKRIDMVVDYIQPLLAKRSEIEKGRKEAIVAVAEKRDKEAFVLDGKLDDKFWEGLTSYALGNLTTGEKPDVETTYKVASADGFLYFGIHCAEPDMENLNGGTSENEDPNVWIGDEVEIMLETPTHAYYQIAISPSGSIMDVDWKTGFDTTWASGAEVSTQHGKDFWTVEIRVPVAGAAAERVDSKNGVAGDMPSEEDPWFFNVYRQRMRGESRELFGFSPTDGDFLQPDKFGKLIVR